VPREIRVEKSTDITPLGISLNEVLANIDKLCGTYENISSLFPVDNTFEIFIISPYIVTFSPIFICELLSMVKLMVFIVLLAVLERSIVLDFKSILSQCNFISSAVTYIYAILPLSI
jgi:hypothetical protein